MLQKNNAKILLLAFILLSCTTTSHAQKKKYKDYLITNKDDTIYGKFKKPLMGQLRFESGDDMYELDPEQFKAYYDSNDKKVYERKIINHKPMWLSCIINGRIKLYEQFYNTSQADGRFLMVRIWLAQKEDTPLMEVMSSTLNVQKPVGKENLEYLVRDNARLFANLQQSTNYNYKIAKAYIEAYNDSAP
ncbi:MAG: hypothetical protein QM610_09165 [Chitinophagaceae bacterium]